MSNGQYRRVWLIALQNFLNSFRPKQIRGNHMGKDYIGNTYFEIPAKPSEGKRKPVRWYEPPKDLDFEDPVPAEWESWLRMRRAIPPTAEEITQNMALAKLKKENAAKLEIKRLAEGGSLPLPAEKGPESFPKYSEYHSTEPEGRRRQD